MAARDPLLALWGFAWAMLILIVASRYLWLLGVLGAGR